MAPEISALLVDRSVTLKEAMRRLEETAERILFVVDEDRLFGTLTDGDIRRWILAEGELNATVEDACNRSPLTAEPGYDLESIRAAMLERKIGCIPVTQQGRIVELLFWEQVFLGDVRGTVGRSIDVPVVIMAGGKGTRLDPFTKVLPKPLIPIGDKTVLEIIVEGFHRVGVQDFYAVLHTKSKIVKSYFEELNPPYRMHFVEETEPRGTAGGLGLLAGTIEGPFILTNCDVIIRADFAALLDVHRASGNDVTVVASMKTFRIPYGVCDIGPNGSLGRVREKPEYNMLVNTGLYVLEAGLLDAIPKSGMYHATQLMDDVRRRGGRIGVFPIAEDAWFDTGEWAEYKRAIAQLSL